MQYRYVSIQFDQLGETVDRFSEVDMPRVKIDFFDFKGISYRYLSAKQAFLVSTQVHKQGRRELSKPQNLG